MARPKSKQLYGAPLLALPMASTWSIPAPWLMTCGNFPHHDKAPLPVHSVTQGKNGRMPQWGDLLKPEEIQTRSGHM